MSGKFGGLNKLEMTTIKQQFRITTDFYAYILTMNSTG